MLKKVGNLLRKATNSGKERISLLKRVATNTVEESICLAHEYDM